MRGGLHDSTDEPPAVPAFQNVTPKCTRSTIGALTDAAEAIVKSFNKQPSTDVTPPVSLTTIHSTLLKPVESMGISSGKAADL